MNTSWLTWPCFWFGVKALLISAGGVGTLLGVIRLSYWVSEDKEKPELVLGVWVTLLALFIIAIGMLQCAGVIK